MEAKHDTLGDCCLSDLIVDLFGKEGLRYCSPAVPFKLELGAIREGAQGLQSSLITQHIHQVVKAVLSSLWQRIGFQIQVGFLLSACRQRRM